MTSAMTARQDNDKSRSKGKGKAKAKEEEKVTASLPLGKQLAHTDKAVRDRAIRSLTAFLSRGGETTDTEGDGAAEAGSSKYVRLADGEMAKLWKGLFYCFWMSDKPLVQQGLARDLSELLLSIDPELDPSVSEDARSSERLSAALDFLRGFWEAMVREWEGLDRLRMDKFYLLIRRYVNASFRLLEREEWSQTGVEGMVRILAGSKGPLSYTNPKIPISLSTHLSDIYLHELDLVLASSSSSSPAPLLALLQPFIALLANTPSPVVYKRLLETLFSPLLAALQVASADPEPLGSPAAKKRKRSDEVYAHVLMNSCLEPGGEKASVDELKRALLKALFEEAAKEGARESNRRKIYQLWREEGGDDE